MTAIEGLDVATNDDLPPLFTVVPIIALTQYVFGTLSFEPENTTDVDLLCASLVHYETEEPIVSTQF